MISEEWLEEQKISIRIKKKMNLMYQKPRHRKNSSNLFDPNIQGLSTYDLTYITSVQNRVKNEELLLKSQNRQVSKKS